MGSVDARAGPQPHGHEREKRAQGSYQPPCGVRSERYWRSGPAIRGEERGQYIAAALQARDPSSLGRIPAMVHGDDQAEGEQGADSQAAQQCRAPCKSQRRETDAEQAGKQRADSQKDDRPPVMGAGNDRGDV